MSGRARSALYAAGAALNGVAGLAAARCTGGACRTCLACAVPVAGVVLLALIGRRGKAPEGEAPAGARGPAELAQGRG